MILLKKWCLMLRLAQHERKYVNDFNTPLRSP